MAEPIDPKDLRASIDNMAMLYAGVSKHAADIANARRSLFEAYISEGFTVDQALELIKVIP